MRRSQRKLPGLPPVNPGSVVQREELIGILLEWASGDGPLSYQDRELAQSSDFDAAVLAGLRTDLKKALANCGISDPGTVVNQVRQLALSQEAANPQLPMAQWRAQAVLQGA